MIIQGKTVNVITLNANEMATIKYDRGYFFIVDIVNYGQGIVYVNWQGTATIGDTNALMLIPMQAYQIRINNNSSNIELNIISSEPSTVQVVRTVM